uniref:glutamine amidotransferase-like class 1 domain-containing protein 3, mitochondrial n=1 Tax=Pristiophorus japonicus TaxID=55135 RepID=UPI00398E5A68
MGKTRVAVILAGCGVYDGTEVHESSAVMVHLSRAGAEVQLYAPNVNQMHVVNHLTSQPTEEVRNVLVESSRIARANIKDLVQLSVNDTDALIIPGKCSDLQSFTLDHFLKTSLDYTKITKDYSNIFPSKVCCVEYIDILYNSVLP